jgi:hypothetical protein
MIGHAEFRVPQDDRTASSTAAHLDKRMLRS